MKVFDPCVGFGVFLIACYYKFMSGLEKNIPDKQKRSKHIIDNMLYGCDI
jgi:hypothetical protein